MTPEDVAAVVAVLSARLAWAADASVADGAAPVESASWRRREREKGSGLAPSWRNGESGGFVRA
ncbi:acyl-CoA carboxylase epsilon subunit [Nocardiopsis halotolerans]|uniref:acyl-CoA carboxylase epsilon subunit n=1 Tax=Nocardiopsis halotolerans TaxID=124252 RepID=UPI000360FD24